MRSGQADAVAIVTGPAATIATFAATSLRADKKAARVRLPACVRTRISRKAQVRFTANAPMPVSDRLKASGGIGAVNFPHAVHKVAAPGTRISAAKTMPTNPRARADQ